MKMVPFRELSEDRKMEIVSELMSDVWYEDCEADFLEKLSEFGFENPEIAFSGFCSQGDGASFTCSNIDVSLFLKKFWSEMDFQHEALDRWEEFEKSGASSLIQLGFEPEDLDESKPMTLRIMEGEFDIFYGEVKRSPYYHYFHEDSTDLYLYIDGYDVVDNGESNPEALEFEAHEEDEILALYEYLESWMEEWMRDFNRELYRALYKEYYGWGEELMKQLESENEEWPE